MTCTCWAWSNPCQTLCSQVGRTRAVRSVRECISLGAQAELSGEQLDVLALLFTAVKILFVGGAIARVTRLIQV